MKKKAKKKILPIAVAAFAVAAMAAAPALAKDSQKKESSPSSAAAAVAAMGANHEDPSSMLKPNQHDTKPGPDFTTVNGKLTKIEGDVYVVQTSIEDYRGTTVNANEMRVYVGKQTKKLGGEKKVGDTVRAEITRGGFANSIQ
jgi:hypothetical protein